MARKLKVEGTYGFTLDRDRLEQIVLGVNEAVKRGEGIFKQGIRKFLPQWNLPPELEYSPQQKETTNPAAAARFLWTRLFCDRMSNSAFLLKVTKKAWQNQETNWLYDPAQVVERTPQQIAAALREVLKFAIKNKSEENNGARYRDNAQRLLDLYDGDPRNTIRYKTTDEAREHLMRFQGIGTGLANLFIMECGDRNIANPTDPENMKFKIDRHKGGIAIYTGCVVPHNGEIDFTRLVPTLEDEYRKAYQKYELDPKIIDAGLWIIGSQVCARNEYGTCLEKCPFAGNLCISRVPIGQKTGRYLVTVNGKRVETRKGASQGRLFYQETEEKPME